MSYISAEEIAEALEKVLNNPFDMEEYSKQIAAEQKAKYKEIFAKPITAPQVSFNPVVYDNEPYTPAETVQDIVNDYCNALNILRQKYNETEDERYARLLLDLLPADICWAYI